MKKKLSLLCLGLSVLSLAGTIVSMIFYFINNAKINGIDFIEIANKSVWEAKELLDHTSNLGWLTVILAIVTGVLIIATVLMFILAARDKKKNISKNLGEKEEVNHEG